MTTYYIADLFNSIIRNEADSGNLASENADVSGHAKTTNFILCGQCGVSNSGACNKAVAATSVKIQFNKDGGGTWYDVGASSEIAYANVSGLTNDATGGTARCSTTPTGCTGASSVKDCEDGAVTTPALAAEAWAELKFGLSPANSVSGVKYAFRLYDVTNSLPITGTNANWQSELTIASGTQYPQSVSGAMPAASGTLAGAMLVKKVLSGAMPAASGALAKFISTHTSGAMGAVSGGVAKLTSRLLSGALPSQSGTLDAIMIYLSSLSGAMPAASGGIVKSILKGVSGAMPAAAGAISRLIAKNFSGTMPSGSGLLNKLTSVSRYGAMPEATGQTQQNLNTTESVAGAMPAATGILDAILNPIGSAYRKIRGIIGRGFKYIVGG